MLTDAQRAANRRRHLRRVEDAKLIRWWLMDIMGDRCAIPGCQECLALELDHPYGRTWEPRKVHVYKRMQLYLMDWAAGNLRILCRHHNAKDGGGRRKGAHGHTYEPAPF